MLTQNMGINLISIPFLAAVGHCEVSLSALGAVTSVAQTNIYDVGVVAVRCGKH